MIVANPDTKQFIYASEKVFENEGYCPCALIKDEDTLCMCKAFKEAVDKGYIGLCECGRFLSE